MRLVEWRQITGKKQSEVADAIGVSTSQLSKVERGETFTSPQTAERIMDFTSGAVTPNDLHDAWRSRQGERAS